MSLHLFSLFAAHPAKLINLLALLFACPGGWVLHATRRRELRARVSLQTRSGNGEERFEALLDLATQRMNRFFYRFGFGCLALALLVSWISTQIS
ncbi:hypothetical protein E3Z27_23520 [Pseudomonas mediterranea]|uniref:hypothetical protein n=1 Tax=Pseudomonas mediterranea TaxID=183795 RepID=UPI0013194828|nr:hypothetical protein [Pseudomonas mediterranea]QHA84417.1 hypothetical protein E3Z27_23520 [Pseudomonas mediterranea]CAH0275110.1 hypothetical protein SRABI112_03754 [Pseudomonas mediterranea]